MVRDTNNSNDSASDLVFDSVSIHSFIHSLFAAYPNYTRVTGSLCLSQASLGHQGRIHPGGSANPSQGTHTLSFTHAITHYGQFRDANQPTMHVFGLGEETGVPGGNPRGTGRTWKLHTHMAEAGIEPPTMEV
ncbi:hypothetical protein QTP70_015103 [Hemibagrus guttatus]|uniref:Uncharacterized protein n=1 Tax=Hemibagrus guttatus TaxID=175788 RepID=A0AAE0RCD8_9TELE|nr:hypothetical protein QTP70_015103 [Hemibagrus guttatus]